MGKLKQKGGSRKEDVREKTYLHSKKAKKSGYEFSRYSMIWIGAIGESQ